MEIINAFMFEESCAIGGNSPCELLEAGTNGCATDALAPPHLWGGNGAECRANFPPTNPCATECHIL